MSFDHSTDTSSAVIKIAVLAVGGQGGGVLTDWIGSVARRAGYTVQTTSVAGVAQRTGATIYYVEMAPATDQPPVFALNPSPGDVDILIAAELMEAGRAILRGFVTEDKTTLIASSHRVLAISEKQVPGDGRAEARIVAEQFTSSALKTVCFDMQAIADQAGTMISASLFGALARSGALPFEQSLYEDVIRDSGRGVEQSLAAFHAAIQYDMGADTRDDANPAVEQPMQDPTGPTDLVSRWQQLRERVQTLPSETQSIVMAGLAKTVDYQDLDYGEQYLQHVVGLIEKDSPAQGYALGKAAAKYIANAMCYDDILRVAELKTRSSRDERVRREQRVSSDQIMQVTEYFHPRAEEFCLTLPAGLGAWIERTPRAMSITKALLDKGRRIRTDGVIGFSLLWVVAGIRPYRSKLLRHRYETEHLNQLLANTHDTVNKDYPLAVELLQCQRLIKGYSDTHKRSQSKYNLIMAAATQSAHRPGAAAWVRTLRETALQDEQGNALKALLADDLPTDHA